MNMKDAEFLKRLQATFRVEAEEHIRTLRACLVELEQTPKDEQYQELIETAFREVHSLKGAARSVNLNDIETICKALEGAFALLKRKETAFSLELCDIFHQASDTITTLVSNVDKEMPPQNRVRMRELILQLSRASQPGPPQESLVQIPSAAAPPAEPPPISPAPAKEDPVQIETVRIPTAKLDVLLLQAEEMITAKNAAAQRISELHMLERALAAWKTDKARAALYGAEHNGMMTEHNFHEFQEQLSSFVRAMEQDEHTLKHMVDEHLEAMKSAIMLPVATLAEAFPAFIRQLARDEGKEAELHMRGSEVEMDKRILDELKDPLIHLLRNCIGHGIEKPQIRRQKNKPVRGAISLSFSVREGRKVDIVLSDDGAGIDIAQVRAATLKMGILSNDDIEKLGSSEMRQMVFQSGISTSPIVTDISGHGLGLAIVKEKVKKIGGAISVESEPGAGTTFHMQVPVTLATFRGILIQAGGHLFVMPAEGVEHVLRAAPHDIYTIENREAIQFEGCMIPAVKLADVLGMPSKDNDSPSVGQPGQAGPKNFTPMLIITYSGRRIAFQVEAIFEEQQILVKGLGKQLDRVRNITGATILGNGKVVPVLNVSDLFCSALRPSGIKHGPGRQAITEKSKMGRILVAEDSITARTLLKNILETAGYQVSTATDGIDGFTQLHNSEFDLVVSDVDMPRMNGFELTARIRANKHLQELPIILVTALESREDRERGIDVGANAYIIKSSFDQSNLLEVIKRFI